LVDETVLLDVGVSLSELVATLDKLVLPLFVCKFEKVFVSVFEVVSVTTSDKVLEPVCKIVPLFVEVDVSKSECVAISEEDLLIEGVVFWLAVSVSEDVSTCVFELVIVRLPLKKEVSVDDGVGLAEPVLLNVDIPLSVLVRESEDVTFSLSVCNVEGVFVSVFDVVSVPTSDKVLDLVFVTVA